MHVLDALTRFHTDHAGAASAVFGGARLFAGDADLRVTSYAWCAERVPAGTRAALDLACGDGALLAALRARLPRARVCGLDRSTAELAAARRLVGDAVELVRGDARELPLPGGSFDAVTCHMALMLMPEVERALAEVHRVLRKGGVFTGTFGRSAPSTPHQRSVLEALHGASERAGLRIDYPPPVAPLFRDALAPFAQLETIELTLRCEVPRAEFARFLALAYYECALLPPHAREHLLAEVAPALPDLIHWEFGMLGFVATKEAEPSL